MSDEHAQADNRGPKKGVWIGGLLVVALVLGGGAWVWMQNQKPPPDEEAVEAEANPNDTAPPDSRAETEEHLRSIGYVQ